MEVGFENCRGAKLYAESCFINLFNDIVASIFSTNRDVNSKAPRPRRCTCYAGISITGQGENISIQLRMCSTPRTMRLILKCFSGTIDRDR